MNQNSLKISKIVYPLVALTLILIVMLVTTFSWLKENHNADISGNEFITISADTGLEMSYGDNSLGSTTLQNVTLSECSSVDGRNFFFPLSNYADGGDNDFANVPTSPTNAQAVDTKDLVFREGTANDKNQKYISVDLTLKSTASTNTEVYLSRDTRISCTNPNNTTAHAIRVAFIENETGRTLIFDNSSDAAYRDENDAVKTISDNGEKLTTELCKPYAFNQFIYGSKWQQGEEGEVGTNRYLFNIEPGKEINVTVNIWLEGTDKDCTESVLNKDDLSILIKFSTTKEDSREIKFVDNTLEKWVANDKCYVFAIDNYGTFHRMTKPDYKKNDFTWTVDLPQRTETVKFVRYNPDKSVNDKEWNYWDTETLGECSTYVAFGHSAGMWAKDTSAFTTITLFDGTPNGYLTSKNSDLMHLTYSIVDGNGNTKNFDYKMSFQITNHRWRIVIPDSVQNISFKYMDKEGKNTFKTWSGLGNRGTNHFISLNTETSGYWGDKLLFINDNAQIKDTAVFATCFFNSGNDHTWTSMRAIVPASGNTKTTYVGVIPNNRSSCTVTKYNSSATTWEWNWGNTVYNQASDYTGGFSKNKQFTTSSWNDSDTINGHAKIQGTWSDATTSW